MLSQRNATGQKCPVMVGSHVSQLTRSATANLFATTVMILILSGEVACLMNAVQEQGSGGIASTWEETNWLCATRQLLEYQGQVLHIFLKIRSALRPKPTLS